MANRCGTSALGKDEGAWIQVHSPSPQIEAHVRQCAPPGVQVLGRVPPNRTALSPPIVHIVGGMEDDLPWVQEELKRLERICPPKRILLLLPFSRSVAGPLSSAPCGAILWLDGTRTTLQKALKERVEEGALAETCSLFWSACDGDQVLRTLVERAFRTAGPIRSVQDLSRLVHRGPTTLRRRWRGLGLPGSLSGLHHWRNLSVLVERREAGMKLDEIAKLLDLDPATLHRISHRFLGCSPGQATRERILHTLNSALSDLAS